MVSWHWVGQNRGVRQVRGSVEGREARESQVYYENSGQAGLSPGGLQEAEEVPGAVLRRQSRGQDHLASRWDTWVQTEHGRVCLDSGR